MDKECKLTERQQKLLKYGEICSLKSSLIQLEHQYCSVYYVFRNLIDEDNEVSEILKKMSELSDKADELKEFLNHIIWDEMNKEQPNESKE